MQTTPVTKADIARWKQICCEYTVTQKHSAKRVLRVPVAGGNRAGTRLLRN